MEPEMKRPPVKGGAKKATREARTPYGTWPKPRTNGPFMVMFLSFVRFLND